MEGGGGGVDDPAPSSAGVQYCQEPYLHYLRCLLGRSRDSLYVFMSGSSSAIFE